MKDRGFQGPDRRDRSFRRVQVLGFRCDQYRVPRRPDEVVGHIITAGVIAGGSKASIKLFHDVMGAMSDAEKKRKQLNV